MNDKDEQLNEILASGPGRGMSRRGMSRRDLFRYAGAGAGAAGLSALLAACGVSGQSSSSSSSSSAGDVFSGQPSGELNFANWPLYIDKKRINGKVVHPSIEQFTKKTGIKVSYKEVINANDEFFGKIQPSLQAGQDTGYDLMVITNGFTLDKMLALDYLVELDHSKLPNYDKYAAPKYKQESFDPGNRFTIPWQSGITGIGYDPNLTGREITSFNDLFDPAFKGKVGMFGDNQDLPNLTLVGMGINPADSTPDDWKAAAAKLTKQRDAGIVRQYYVQDYTKPLQAGDLAVTMAWSGDIFILNQSGSPQLKFVVPEEGGVLWTDNMCIPQKAQHPVDAITYMDYVYKPEIAATIAEYVWYITPVPDAKKVVTQDAKKPGNGSLKDVAESPLIFPTEQTYSNLYQYKTLNSAQEEEWNAIFQPVYQS